MPLIEVKGFNLDGAPHGVGPMPVGLIPRNGAEQWSAAWFPSDAATHCFAGVARCTVTAWSSAKMTRSHATSHEVLPCGKGHSVVGRRGQSPGLHQVSNKGYPQQKLAAMVAFSPTH